MWEHHITFVHNTQDTVTYLLMFHLRGMFRWKRLSSPAPTTIGNLRWVCNMPPHGALTVIPVTDDQFFQPTMWWLVTLSSQHHLCVKLAPQHQSCATTFFGMHNGYTTEHFTAWFFFYLTELPLQTVIFYTPCFIFAIPINLALVSYITILSPLLETHNF